MTGLRIFALIVIFVVVSVGWLVLGGAMVTRTDKLDASLSGEMATLWGPKALVQQSPFIAASAIANPDGDSVWPAASSIVADIDHTNRYKGLLWYSTFRVKFTGKYTVPASLPTVGAEAAAVTQTAVKKGYFVFALPPSITTYYEQPSVQVDGKAWIPTAGELSGGRLFVPIDRAEKHVIDVSYSAGAQDAWVYYPSIPGAVRSCDGAVYADMGTMATLNDFDLTVKTNFADIDYPRGTQSPTDPAALQDGGREAHWHFGSAMTNRAVGVVMPSRQNAGPIAARMSFFAPVSLLFFFTAVFAVVILKKIQLHPMHYMFISAGFFAFHILMAYLVDLVNIHAAFWICAAVSVMLVVSYLRVVAGMKFAVLYAGMAQLVFLVGFSYAFFWTGYTGLTITIGAIIMLFVIMQATGKVNWNEAFKSKKPRSPMFNVNGAYVQPPPIRETNGGRQSDIDVNE